MKKLRNILIFLALFSTLLASCDYIKVSVTASYFDETVIVERVRVQGMDNDEINVTFLRKGTYDIAYLPIEPGGDLNAPQSTTVVIDSAPKTLHFEKLIISDLRVAITIDGVIESQSFILE